MNNDDLIERWKSLRESLDSDLKAISFHALRNQIDETLAALSPVLPEDAEDACQILHENGYPKIIHLIERLARENAELKQEQLNGHNWELECEQLVHAEEVAELQARIKELESELALASKNNNQQTT